MALVVYLKCPLYLDDSMSCVDDARRLMKAKRREKYALFKKALAKALKEEKFNLHPLKRKFK